MTRTAMIKTLLLGAALALTTVGGAFAQDRAPPSDSTTEGGAGVRSGHITSTGETVPNPGASQSAGTTSMDRGIQARDNAIEKGICKGC